MKCADESEIAPRALAKDGSLYVQCFEAADHVATPRAGSAAYPPIAAVRGARRQRQSWAKTGRQRRAKRGRNGLLLTGGDAALKAAITFAREARKIGTRKTNESAPLRSAAARR